MKKLLSIFILGIMLISLASAWELNPFADKKIFEPKLKEDMPSFIKDDFNSQYGVIRISKTSFWVETDKIAEYSLIDNTEQCLIDCSARGKAVLYFDGKLFEDMNFKDIAGRLKQIDYKIYLKGIEKYDVELPDKLKEVCEKIDRNGTGETLCWEEVDTYKTETREREIWSEYTGDYLKSGDYEWKIEGKKKPYESVDWIGTARGKEFNEWAWWNSDWNFRKQIDISNYVTNLANYSANITINYDSDMQTDFDDIRFLNGSNDLELGFWNYTQNASQVSYYVMIPMILNNSNTSIYVYYGNTGASNGANRSKAFMYFDDFDYNWKGAGYGWVAGTDTYSITGGQLVCAGGGVDYQDLGTSNWWNSSTTYGYEVIGNVTTTDISTQIRMVGDFRDASARTRNLWSGGYVHGDYSGRGDCIPSSDGNCAGTSAIGDNTNTIEMFRWFNTAGATKGNQTGYLNGVQQRSYQGSGTSADRKDNVNSFQLVWSSERGSYKVNWIQVRGYIYPEPSISAMGGEESRDFRVSTTTQSYPQDGYNTTDSTPDLSCNFTGNEYNNISSVKILVYDNAGNLDYDDTDTGNYGVSYNKTWTTTALTDDIYKWACFGYGDGGKNSSTSNRTFTKYSIGVTLNAPADSSTQYNNPVLFNGSLSGNISAFSNATLYINGNPNQTILPYTGIQPVSYYNLDETTGTIAYSTNASYNGNNTGAVINKIGKIIRGYEFNSSDYIEIGTPLPTGNNPRALSMWIKSDDWNASQNYALFRAGANSGSEDYSISITTDAVGYKRVSIRLNTNDVQTTNFTMNNGEWYNLVVSYDGSSSHYHEFYINNNLVSVNTSFSVSGALSTKTNTQRIGTNYAHSINTPVYIDEVAIFNRSLSATEVSQIYSNGNARRIVEENYLYSVGFNSGDSVTWNIYACDSDGDCGFAPANRTFTMDSSAPTIEVLYPNGTIPYGYAGQNISLNYSIVDTNVQSCWYDYNGTNLTIPCTTNSTFILSSKKNFNMYANDRLGNLRTYAHSWNYSIFKNNMTFNPTTYQTKNESFTINISENPSLTNAFLVYDSVNYQTSQSGQIWTSYVPITSSASGNKSFYWSFNNSGTFINTETNYQNIEPLVFSLCNSTNNTPYLNITFKDEDDDSDIYASISTSTFLYYLDVSSYNKTYIFQNNTANPSYSFCGSPAHLNISVDYTLSYRNITAYPLRTYNQDLISLSNQTTNTSLYLLSDTDGLYTTFQVLSTSGNPLNGVEVTGTRQSGATTLTVATGTTDSAGAVTFFLNPDYLHTFTFEKTGYNSYTTTVTPSSTTYTVTLSSTAIEGQIADYSRGITQVITPSTQSLNNHTYYVFNYSLTSTYWTISEFGFTLRYSNGTTIGTINQITSGGSVVMNVTTANSTRIIMDYYYLANSTYVNGTRYWLVSRTSDFSIMHFFSDLNLYLSANLYGINGEDGDDTFGMSLIAVLILVLTAGMLTYRYGIQSEASILAIITGIVMFLNFVGFIPNPDFLPSRVNLGEVLVFISAVITIGFIIKEESR